MDEKTSIPTLEPVPVATKAFLDHWQNVTGDRRPRDPEGLAITPFGGLNAALRSVRFFELTDAAEKAWAWLCSDWGDSDGEPFKQEAIDALRKALDGVGKG